MFDKPDLFFRRRDRGAIVYRIETGSNGRLEMTQIAILKPNGEIKPANKATLDDSESAQIRDWFEAREKGRSAREMARMDDLVGDINAAAQWLQTGATPEQAQAVSQDLLLSLHDLRAALVKKLSKQTN